MKVRNNYIPDVLDCLANLSSDEVFTPPIVANRMLDMLPQEIFKSKETTFLDPFSKSGVFLREITKRLLENQIPNYKKMASEIEFIEKGAIQEAVKNGTLDLNDKDYEKKAKEIGYKALDGHKDADIYHLFEDELQETLNHILTKQVYGIAITELTAQLTRRSLYCSKDAACRYSICTDFGINKDGNIRFVPMRHTWKNQTCIYCGVNAKSLDRPNELESHAYEIIHRKNPEEIYNMEFTVVCGNPPFQLSFGLDGGNSANAKSIYNLFIDTAIRLNPKHIVMITPSRWMTKTAQGIPDSWVDGMLGRHDIKEMYDYEDASMCFPNVEIKGGVSYFHIEKGLDAPCKYVFCAKDGSKSERTDYLEYKNSGMVVRDLKALSILQKIEDVEKNYFIDDRNMSSLVSPKHFFDDSTYLTSNWKDYKDEYSDEYSIKYYVNVNGKREIKWISSSQLPKNKATLPLNKVFIPAAGGSGTDSKILSMPILGEPNSVCSQTYLVIGYDAEKHNFTKTECENIISYIKTKFFRYLVSIKKKTQNGPRGVYQFVPLQDFNITWTDDALYQKYHLSDDEIKTIEESIIPME